MGGNRIYIGLVKVFVFVIGALLILLISFLVVGQLIYRYRSNSQLSLTVISPPETHRMINSGNGLNFVIEAIAENGLAQVVVKEDDQIIDHISFDQGLITSRVLYYQWMSSGLGIHKISFSVVDLKGMVSQPEEIIVSIVPNAARIDPDDGLYPLNSFERRDGSVDENEVHGLPVIGDMDDPPPNGEMQSQGQRPFDLNPFQDQLDSIELSDQFPQDLVLVSADDLPPVIEIMYDLVDHSSVAVAVTITDDVQVDSIDLWYGPEGGVLTNENIICQSPECVIHRMIQFSDQTQTVIARAYDSLGQASEVVRITLDVLVSNNQNLPPAIAVAEDVVLLDSGCDSVQQIQGNVFIDPLIFGNFPGNGLQIASCGEVDDDAGGGGDAVDLGIEDWEACMDLYAIWDQNDSSLDARFVVNCPLNAPEGYEIVLEFEHLETLMGNSINQISEGASSLSSRSGSIASPRTQISAFENFYYYSDINTYSCELTQKLNAGLSLQPVGMLDDGIFNPNLYSISREFFPISCSPDYQVPGLDLAVFDHPDGYRVEWSASTEVMAALGLNEGQSYEARFMLTDRTYDSRTLLERETQEISSFPASGEFLQRYSMKCMAPPYFQIILFDPISEEIKGYTTAIAPESFCLVNRLPDWTLQAFSYHIDQGFGDTYLQTRIELKRTNQPWEYPSDQDLIVISVDRFEGHPYMRVTNEYRQDQNARATLEGEIFECGLNQPYRLQAYITNYAGGEIGSPDWHGPITDRSKVVYHWPAPCLPPPPANMSLHAVTDPAGNSIRITWDSGWLQDNRRYFAPTGLLLVKQVVSGFVSGQSIIEIPFETTSSYVDYEVSPGVKYIYRLMYVVNDHYGEQNSMWIVTPQQESGWDCLVYPANLPECD